jgi:cell division protein ZapA (FtsZ GTPase activity inhibitor)
MVDLTEEEKSAMRRAMQMVAEVMEEIGWQTRLIDLSEPQVLTLIEVASGGVQDAMREIAAANEQPSPKVPF